MELQDFCSLGGKARALKLSKERRAEIAREASKVRWLTKATKAVPEPTKARRCQSSHCPNQGNPILIHGLKAYLCPLHTPKQ